MLPSQKDIEIPLLQVLVELGGQANPKDVYPQVAKKFSDVPEAEFKSRLNSGTIKWNNRVQFTRQRLKDNGEIDSPARGIWRITQKGRERVSHVANITIDIETPKYLKGTLVTGNDLRTATRIRKSNKILKSVPKNQVDTWIKDGFSIEREFSRNVQISKLKPIGDQFENEIWLLMRALGFSVLNRSKDFMIDVSIPSKPTQWEKIDVFAKDDDHVFVIECECAEKPSNRHPTVKAAVDSFASNDSRIRDAVRKFFGDDKTKRLKISYIIATRNLNWSENNLRRAENNNIFVWKDEDIDKLTELAKLHSLIGDAVRFHLYASMFRGQEIRALTDQQVAAIKGKAGNYTYYQFIATPKQLLPIAFVHRREAVIHREFDFEELTHSYQRMLKKSKVKAIGEFVDERKYFPNNIIISFDEEPRFDLSPGQNNFEFKSGTLILPSKYGSAWIIDGQHRLFGFANSEKGENDPIPVIAFRNLSVSEQAKLFIEINKNQTNVDSNLLWDLYGDIYRGSRDHSQIEELTISNAVKLLDSMKGSPFFKHIFVPSHGKKSKKRNLTMSTLCQGMKRNKLLSVDMLGRGRQGRNQTKYEEFAAERIVAFFGVVESLYPEDWKKGDDGYLRTNNGISAFLIIFRRILRHLNSHEKFIYARVNVSEFEEEVFKLLSPAIEYLYKSRRLSLDYT